MSEEDTPDDEPEIDSAATVRGVRRKLTKLERAEEERRQFWRAILASPIGRRELWSIFDDAGVFKNQFGTGPNGFPSPEVSWFNLGKKDLGERLYRSLARIDRASIFLMHDEYDPAFAVPKRQSRTVDGD